MKCAICGIEIETIQESMEQGWLPSLYEGEKEHGPGCSSCADQMIIFGDYGEMELKAEYCGKIQYMDGDYSSAPEKKDLVIEIFITNERKGQRH